MFSGAHVILYSQDADADRAFIRDVLGFRHVDAGHGWLIFTLPPAEVAVHPTDGAPQHELYLMCDDLDAVLTALAARGVETTRPVTEERWGRLTAVRLPSGSELPLYQPLHPVAHSL
jgi:catechol 2,3-dioxygenase-like lactoylglutathione lyase family enzyme